MKRIVVGLCLYFLLIAAVPNARGDQLLKFERAVQGNPTFTTPFIEGFYTYFADSYQIIDSPGLCGCASNGTKYFATSRAMTMGDGGPIGLLNFDAAQLYSPGDPRNATTIVAVAHAGSFQSVEAFTLPTDGSFATFSVLGLGGLSLEFYGIGQDATHMSFAIDNIHTVSSPEPASIALILSGFGGLVFAVRRQKRHS